jgi:hypothetical protein
MSTEVRVDVQAFVEIITYLEDLAERMRGDREMFGEREAADAEDHVIYLIHALQELTPDTLTDYYGLRRIQKGVVNLIVLITLRDHRRARVNQLQTDLTLRPPSLCLCSHPRSGIFAAYRQEMRARRSDGDVVGSGGQSAHTRQGSGARARWT